MALSYKKAAEGFPSAAVRVLFLDGGADDLHHRIMQVFPLQGKIDLCLQEAFFVTDIIASALKIIGVDRFLSAQASVSWISLPLPGACVSSRSKMAGVST